MWQTFKAATEGKSEFPSVKKENLTQPHPVPLSGTEHLVNSAQIPLSYPTSEPQLVQLCIVNRFKSLFSFVEHIFKSFMLMANLAFPFKQNIKNPFFLI